MLSYVMPPPLAHSLVMATFVLQSGCSPLHMASFKGHLDTVKTLIEARANVNQATKVHCTVQKLTSYV